MNPSQWMNEKWTYRWGQRRARAVPKYRRWCKYATWQRCSRWFQWHCSFRNESAVAGDEELGKFSPARWREGGGGEWGWRRRRSRRRSRRRRREGRDARESNFFHARRMTTEAIFPWERRVVLGSAHLIARCHPPASWLLWKPPDRVASNLPWPLVNSPVARLPPRQPTRFLGTTRLSPRAAPTPHPPPAYAPLLPAAPNALIARPAGNTLFSPPLFDTASSQSALIRPRQLIRRLDTSAWPFETAVPPLTDRRFRSLMTRSGWSSRRFTMLFFQK